MFSPSVRFFNPKHPVRSVFIFALLFPVAAKILLGLICYFLEVIVPEELLYPTDGFLSSLPFPILVTATMLVFPLAEEFFFRVVLFKRLLCGTLSFPPAAAKIETCPHVNTQFWN